MPEARGRGKRGEGVERIEQSNLAGGSGPPLGGAGGGRGGFKTVMKLIGQDCGPSRLPIATSTPAETARLRRDLTRFGFFKWGRR